jgi:acyl-CoA dehydrogenase
MDFQFTDDQKLLRYTYQKFCKKELTPEYVRWLDENCLFVPDDMLEKLAALGTFAINIPEEYGGLGLGMMDLCIVLEELCSAGVALGFATFLPLGFGARPICELGNEEQKQKHLPRIAEGKEKWCMALTEPGGGTDILGAMRTRAVRKGEEYIVNGSKIFISGAHVADYILAVVITDKAAQRKNGLSLLIIDAKTPGITISPISKISIRAISACEVHFEDVRVPAENLLGEENRGWYQLLGTLNPERIGTSVFSLGVAKALLRWNMPK